MPTWESVILCLEKKIVHELVGHVSTGLAACLTL